MGGRGWLWGYFLFLISNMFHLLLLLLRSLLWLMFPDESSRHPSYPLHSSFIQIFFHSSEGIIREISRASSIVCWEDYQWVFIHFIFFQCLDNISNTFIKSLETYDEDELIINLCDCSKSIEFSTSRSLFDVVILSQILERWPRHWFVRCLVCNIEEEWSGGVVVADQMLHSSAKEKKIISTT